MYKYRGVAHQAEERRRGYIIHDGESMSPDPVILASAPNPNTIRRPRITDVRAKVLNQVFVYVPQNRPECQSAC